MLHNLTNQGVGIYKKERCGVHVYATLPSTYVTCEWEQNITPYEQDQNH